MKLECFPDSLVFCVEQQAQEASWLADMRLSWRRDEDKVLSYGTYVQDSRSALTRLMRRFEKLADDSTHYLELTHEYPTLGYWLDANIPIWLRKQATLFSDFLRTDPRLRTRRSKAEATLFFAMQNIKTVTGRFQEDLLASVLSGAPGVPATSSGALKRWRSRENKLWSKWHPPERSADEGYPKLISASSRR